MTLMASRVPAMMTPSLASIVTSLVLEVTNSPSTLVTFLQLGPYCLSMVESIHNMSMSAGAGPEAGPGPGPGVGRGAITRL
ncbi:hypothetical protein CLU79DRAFT_774978 [Phycomyces nitens]|nr:hypothetical protein CLU79DRAFT_774978 [Phycomyces nitens]